MNSCVEIEISEDMKKQKEKLKNTKENTNKRSKMKRNHKERK